MEKTMNYIDAMDFLEETKKYGSQLGLTSIQNLMAELGNIQDKIPLVHIGGTNGKGSCSHTIAAVLQAAGYKVGLFTSPHLIDFRERIRINGEMIPEEYVVNFVEDHRSFFEPLHPSFFELTTLFCRSEGRCGSDRGRHGRTSGLYQYHHPRSVCYYQYRFRPYAISGPHTE